MRIRGIYGIMTYLFLLFSAGEVFLVFRADVNCRNLIIHNSGVTSIVPNEKSLEWTTLIQPVLMGFGYGSRGSKSYFVSFGSKVLEIKEMSPVSDIRAWAI